MLEWLATCLHDLVALAVSHAMSTSTIGLFALTSSVQSARQPRGKRNH